MNDKEIEHYITDQIRVRDITLHDFIGGKYIDPRPEDKSSFPNERARWNKFSCLSGEYRFCELLTEGDYDPCFPYNNLAIPMKDIVRYWWNTIADQEAVIEDIFDELLTAYKDRMLPKKSEEEPVDISDGFVDLLEAV